MNNSIDLSLGLNPRAMAVLHLLTSYGEHKFKDVFITTRAHYNGRECGFSLEISARTFKKNARTVKSSPTARFSHFSRLYIVCAEHRNTDKPIVKHWLDEPSMNGPEMTEHNHEILEDAYRRQRVFDNVDDAADHIVSLIGEYALENSES